MFERATLLLLHHKGAKSGVERVSPLAYRREADAYAVFGSRGGAPTHPDWYFNLMATPDVDVEVGTDTISVHATEVEDDVEHDALYARQVERFASFGEYPKKTDRRFPVIVLERR